MSAPSPNQPPVEKSLFLMSLPLILSFWMRQLFTFVDTIYASSLPDSDACIAAIGLTIPLEFIYIATWVGLSSALTSHLAKAIGRGDNQRIDQLNQAIRKVLVVLIPLFLLGGVALYLIIPHLGLDPAVAAAFRIYGPVLFAGQAAIGFWSILPDSMVKAHHDTRSTMMAGIASNLVNVAFNTLFTFVFHWGVFGLAFSTVLGNFGGLTYATLRARALEKARRDAMAGQQSSETDQPLENPLGLLMKLAIPSAAAYMLMATEGFFMNWMLASVPDPKSALAAYSIYFRVIMFAMGPMIAVTVAMLPFVARYLGQGRVRMVRRSFLETLIWGSVYSLLIVAPICWFGAEPLLHWLSKEPETWRYGLLALRIVPVATLVAIPFFLSRPIFEGSQQGKPTIVVSLLRYVFLTAPMAFGGIWLAQRLGYDQFLGLMIGLTLATAICSTVFLVWALRFLKAQAPREATP